MPGFFARRTIETYYACSQMNMFRRHAGECRHPDLFDSIDVYLLETYGGLRRVYARMDINPPYACWIPGPPGTTVFLA